MTWPTPDVSTTDMDAGTDSPATARASIFDLAQKFNLLRNHVSTFMQGVLGQTTAVTACAAMGAATLTIPYAFSVSKSGFQSTGTLVVFDTVQHQNGAGYSTGTALFTTPATGWYSFSARVRGKNNFAGASGYVMSLYIQGGAIITSSYKYLAGGGAEDYFEVTVAAYYLTAGDIVGVFFGGSLSGSNLTVIADATNRFSGMYLGI